MVSAVLFVNGTLLVTAAESKGVIVSDRFKTKSEFELRLRGYNTEPTSVLTLRDYDENVIAFCFEYDNGYAIIDKEGNIIEHSPEIHSPYYNVVGDAYYGGPLNYYEKSDKEFINLESGKEETEVFHSQSDYWNEIYKAEGNEISIFSSPDVSSLSSSGYDVVTHYANGTPRTLNYNTDGLCGPLAVAILCFYYYDYVSSDYVPYYYASNPSNFYSYLCNAFFILGSGDYTSLKNGMENYLSSRSISNNVVAQTTNFHYFVYYKIAIQARPVILGFYYNPASSSPWSLNHWAVLYGYKEYYMNGTSYKKDYIINDGWGHNQIFVTYNTDYMDGVVGLGT